MRQTNISAIMAKAAAMLASSVTGPSYSHGTPTNHGLQRNYGYGASNNTLSPGRTNKRKQIIAAHKRKAENKRIAKQKAARKHKDRRR